MDDLEAINHCFILKANFVKTINWFIELLRFSFRKKSSLIAVGKALIERSGSRCKLTSRQVTNHCFNRSSQSIIQSPWHFSVIAPPWRRKVFYGRRRNRKYERCSLPFFPTTFHVRLFYMVQKVFDLIDTLLSGASSRPAFSSLMFGVTNCMQIAMKRKTTRQGILINRLMKASSSSCGWRAQPEWKKKPNHPE